MTIDQREIEDITQLIPKGHYYWIIFKRESNDDDWDYYFITAYESVMKKYIEEFNNNFDYQRYSMECRINK